MEKNKYISKMLRVEKLDEDHEDMPKVLSLYYESFPRNELIDFNSFYRSHLHGDVLSFYDEKEFVGFIALLTKGNITNILYFAIMPNLRGKGYGTQSLKQILLYFRPNRIILDVEDPDKSKNEAEKTKRTKRVQFYIRAGFKLTNIKYLWSNEYYVIMINNGGDLSQQEFFDFWKYRK